MRKIDRLVVIGDPDTGQLAHAFREIAPDAAFHRRRYGFDLATMTDQGIEEVIASWAPATIINTAAYTKVDTAEVEEELATRINGTAVIAMAKACQRLHARFITYSSDYVFDGRTTRSAGYTEEMPTGDPEKLSAYGRSKLVGEESLRAYPLATTIRTSWLFGQGRNFVKAILAEAAKGTNPLSAVYDQIGRPTYALDLARMTLDYLKTEECVPTLHISNSGVPTAWDGFAREIFALMGREIRVKPVSTEEFFQDKSPVAERPRFSVFDLSLLGSLGIHMRPWDQALEEYLATL